MRKNQKDTNSLNIYNNKDIIELLKNELCINILQLTYQLFISCHITNPKYDLDEDKISKKNINCIKFFDSDFNYL